MEDSRWIWQQPDWPHFRWQAERLAPLLRDCAQAQGRLLGMAGAAGDEFGAQGELDALLQNIVTSSAIEGEQLDVGSVRSSLARRLGLETDGASRVSPRSEGLAELMLDATRHLEQPLSLERLLHWHRLLFPAQDDDLLPRRIRIAALRGEEPMQVVSGRLDRPTVHFEAPPRDGLERQLAAFLDWFEASRSDGGLDPLLRAGIAHFWFVTLHPFDDGNGRLTRAITDLALAQGERQAIRLHAMSVSILDDRQGYYRILEASQKGSPPGSNGSSTPCCAACNRRWRASTGCWPRRASGSGIASRHCPPNRSRCSTACSTAASAASKTASAPPSTRPSPGFPRPPPPATSATCSTRVASSACPAAGAAPVTGSTGRPPVGSIHPRSGFSGRSPRGAGGHQNNRMNTVGASLLAIFQCRQTDRQQAGSYRGRP